MNMRRGYVDKLLAAEQDKDIISVSSEAFILVVLESNWDMWMDTYIKNEKEVFSGKIIESTVTPKCTRATVIREKGTRKKERLDKAGCRQVQQAL